MMIRRLPSCFCWIFLGLLLPHRGHPAPSCGVGTSLDVQNDMCLCDKQSDGRILRNDAIDVERTLQNNGTNVFVAGLYDLDNFAWAEEVRPLVLDRRLFVSASIVLVEARSLKILLPGIFQKIFRFTVSLINDHQNGWHDDVLGDGTVLESAIANSACDDTTAARAYWDLRTQNDGPPHGVVGPRCSGSCIAVAQIAGLEQVTQVSPSSTSSKLSDKTKYPFFSRVVSAEETKGLVSMLRSFGWNRVTVLNTDTEYGNDLSTEFRSLWEGEHEDSSGTWKGEVAYSHAIKIDPDFSVNEDSVRQALDGVPTDDPTINSRVIVLLAHDEHTYPILKIATETNFQPDTIWVGTLAWANRDPPDGDWSWLPEFPGYIGLTPYRNRNSDYMDYLKRLQAAQMEEGREPWDELPDYAAEYMVDSILAMAMALSFVPHEMRHNGSLVTSELRNLTFNGVSGKVSFTEEGDRRDPRFTIFNLQKRDEVFSWVDVGLTGTRVGDTGLNEGGVEAICFAEAGCGLSAAPSDVYPVTEAPSVLLIVIPVFVFLLLTVTCLYGLTKRREIIIKKNMTEMQIKMEAMKKIDGELLDIDEQVDQAKRRQESLILQRAQLQGMPDTWSETLDTIVEVPPEDEQYWAVLDCMSQSMDDVHISKLWRIQNTSLWSYYSFHKDRLSMHGIAHGEKQVWHGTSSLDPAVIYDDKQDGFMMQFAAQGFWGRGLYFADKAVYSTHYSYKPPKASFLSSAASGSGSRLGGKADEREMFLAKLLVGNEVLLNRDESPQKASEYRQLTVPPIDPQTGLKYNSVTGHTGGSQVWIVYGMYSRVLPFLSRR